MPARIRYNFSKNRYSDSSLESKSLSIHMAMTDNPNFVTPNPAMPAFLTAITNFGTALVEAQGGDKAKIALKNSYREVLEQMLRTLAMYVTMTAGEDEARLASSGFTLAKTPAPAPPITVPQNLILKNGLNSGELIVSVDSVKGARAYLFQYRLDSPEELHWVTNPGTERKYVFTGLEAGKKYQVRVLVIGVGNQVVQSSAQTRIAI